MSDPFEIRRNLTAFFDEAGGVDAALTIRDTDPARFKQLATKHGVNLPPDRLADLERAVIEQAVQWRTDKAASAQAWFDANENLASAVDALLREREETHGPK